jgi:uncharacterized protein Yka (UPF0111/DUF47 family)
MPDLYELKDIVKFMKAFHEIEACAKDFLYLSAFALANKYKDKIVGSAQGTLKAIEEYKKIPPELRKELENDKSTFVSKITELEKECRKAIT